MKIVNGVPCRKAKIYHYRYYDQEQAKINEYYRYYEIYPDYMLEPYTNEELRWMLKCNHKPKTIMIITLALLDSYEERKEKLGVITNIESRRQNNESKATQRIVTGKQIGRAHV